MQGSRLLGVAYQFSQKPHPRSEWPVEQWCRCPGLSFGVRGTISGFLPLSVECLRSQTLRLILLISLLFGPSSFASPNLFETVFVSVLLPCGLWH
jgi:hypothetical protein